MYRLLNAKTHEVYEVPLDCLAFARSQAASRYEAVVVDGDSDLAVWLLV